MNAISRRLSLFLLFKLGICIFVFSKFMTQLLIDFDVNILWLILAGFAAGFINTIAGGGTLLTLPALIFLGLPPSVANGTNRIAIFFVYFANCRVPFVSVIVDFGSFVLLLSTVASLLRF